MSEIIKKLKKAKSKVEEDERQDARKIIDNLKSEIQNGDVAVESHHSKLVATQLEMAKSDVKLGRTNNLDNLIADIEESDSSAKHSQNNQNKAIFENADEFIDWYYDEQPSKAEVIEEVEKSELELEKLSKSVGTIANLLENKYSKESESTTGKPSQDSEPHHESDHDEEDSSESEVSVTREQEEEEKEAIPALKCESPHCGFTTSNYDEASSLSEGDQCPECGKFWLEPDGFRGHTPQPDPYNENKSGVTEESENPKDGKEDDRLNSAKRIAGEAKSVNLEAINISEIEFIKKAIRFAKDDDADIRYQGTKAISHLFQDTGSSRLKLIDALSDQIGEEGQSLLEAIIEIAKSNIRKNIRGDIRGRVALTIGYIASKRPEYIPVNQILDDLIDILNNGQKRVRRRRATFALTYLAYYDAPDREIVRKRMADVVDSIRELTAMEEKRKTQSVGFRALGYIALSYPEAIAPADSLTNAVTNEKLRPRNRNRALRAIWQLALSRPEIAEELLDTVVRLLSYSADEASDTNYIDGDNIEKHASWVRSNAAKTIAVIAAESPGSVDEEAINELIGLTEAEDYAAYRAILALGELSDEYVDRIIKNEGHEVVQKVLLSRGDRDQNDLSEREATKYGYALWTLLKIESKTSIEWEPAHETVDLLFSVPDSEKTQFHRRRVEGIEILASEAPGLLDYDRVESYLSEREENSSDPTEQDLIKVAQDQLQTDQLGSDRKENTIENYPDIPRLQQVATGNSLSVIEVDDYKPSHSSDIFEVTLELDGKEKPTWLKVVRAGYDPENQVSTNFAHTTELWNEIDSHENIVSILAWGTESQPWVATELLSYNLDTILSPEGINVNKALWIGERLADALQHAHNRGVVHFDLKPENVVFEYRSGEDWDQPKITDWQFAKRVADISGSLRDYDENYAAPEIRDSDWGPVNQRADLYHLGEILYEMLTGKKWSQYARPPESHRNEVSSEVGSLIMELLVRRVGNRPETAAEVRERLRTLRDNTKSGPSTSETTTAVATIEPPLSQIDYLKELRDDSVRACLQQAKDINRKVKRHDLSNQAYQEMCDLLTDLIYELNEHPNPDSDIREGTELYRLVDDIQDTAQSVYYEYIQVDSVHNT